MKNVHLIPTDKPSRLFLNKVNNKLLLDSDTYSNLEKILPSSKYQNIYITSDDEIKEGDFGYNIVSKTIDKFTISLLSNKQYYKKIILTTDPDLIEEGVQAIDNEFLEWFVKNPSCESVEVSYGLLKPFKSTEKGYMIHLPDNGGVVEPKQETLEEAAERLYPIRLMYFPMKAVDLNEEPRNIFNNGAKFQAERMYSEEDMKQFAFECVTNFLSNNNNEIEMSLAEVIINRNNKQFEQQKKK